MGANAVDGVVRASGIIAGAQELRGMMKLGHAGSWHRGPG